MQLLRLPEQADEGSVLDLSLLWQQARQMGRVELRDPEFFERGASACIYGDSGSSSVHAYGKGSTAEEALHNAIREAQRLGVQPKKR